MPDNIQKQSRMFRSGYFNREAFQKQSRRLLVLQSAVAGLRYNIDFDSDEGRELLESLKPGDELKLFRDFENEHDKWAISVYTADDKKLGYVTRYKNEAIARLMDYGKVFYACVDEQASDGDLDEKEMRTRSATEDYRLPFSVYMED